VQIDPAGIHDRLRDERRLRVGDVLEIGDLA